MAVSVLSVDAPDHEFPPVATTAPPIVPEKAAAVRPPPLLLTTTLVTIRCAAWSLLVTVQVLVSPTAIVPVQSAENVASYPGCAFSATPSLLPLGGLSVVAAPVQVPPLAAVTPPTVPEKAAAVRAPPLSLTTTLLMIRCAAWSSLVTVQVLVSPSAIVPVQAAENVASYPGCAFSATLYVPTLISVMLVDAPLQVCPSDAVTPLTLPEKSAGVSEPPFLLITT